MASLDAAAIQHFVKIARHGRHGAASSGERVAHRLAVALQDIGDDAMLLDCTAVEGFRDLFRAMCGPFPTDATKQAVYQTVAQAAGK